MHGDQGGVSAEKIFIRQDGFLRLLAGFGVAAEPAGVLFDELVAAYSEPHRHYHNLRHIDEMLKVVGRLREYATDLPSIELAVWLHDFRYDPQASDNEARSAADGEERLHALGVPDDVTARTVALIQTTTHFAAADVDRDAAVLLDADLAIFGAAPARYDQYAAEIRREYAWVAEADYRRGRATVLESFLRRNRIYRTERLYEMGEEAARANLNRELVTLRTE